MTASLLVVRGRRDGNVAGETRRGRAAGAARSDRPYDTVGAPCTRHTAERETARFHAQPDGTRPRGSGPSRRDRAEGVGCHRRHRAPADLERPAGSAVAATPTWTRGRVGER